jgi:hypothetical protein
MYELKTPSESDLSYFEMFHTSKVIRFIEVFSQTYAFLQKDSYYLLQLKQYSAILMSICNARAIFAYVLAIFSVRWL